MLFSQYVTGAKTNFAYKFFPSALSNLRKVLKAKACSIYAMAVWGFEGNLIFL